MPRQEEIKVQKEKIQNTLRVGTILLVIISIILLAITFFAFRFSQFTAVNNEVVTRLMKNTNKVRSVIIVVEGIIQNEEPIPLSKKANILEVFSYLEKSHNELNTNSITDIFTDEDQILYQYSLQEITKSFNELSGISNLIISQKKGVFENKDIIINQLKTNEFNCLNSLSTLQIWVIDNTQKKTIALIKLIIIVAILILGLIILIYFWVFKPIRTDLRIIKGLALEWNKQIEISQESSNQSKLKKEQSELVLKTKKAQVIKLQQSLEEAIYRTEETNNRKKQIYYDIASELEQHTSFLETQFQIIENQTDVANHENWVQLSSNLDNLNSLVSKFYDSAQTGGIITPKQEVYLTPLISEVIISNTINGNVSFKQLEDLPSVFTDEIELKRVLLPFFEFISICGDIKTVQISAVEKKGFCEFKFIGLPKSFKDLWESKVIEAGNQTNLSSFKLRYAINSIANRGGKTWVQFDIGSKGILIISWVL